MTGRLSRLAAAMLILITFGSFLWGVLGNGVHDFTGQCEQCHLKVPSDDESGHFARNMTVLCRDCHEVSERNSHPTDVVPTMEVPQEFPLDWKGRITCATCHDPHAPDMDNPNLLRSANRGRLFCETCHRDSLPLGGEHHTASAVVHSKATTPENFDSLAMALDEVSFECLQCHDGTIAIDAGNGVSDGDATYFNPSLDHPIGIDYGEAANRAGSGLKPLGTLSPYVSLYEGKVGCGSCHNVFSPEKSILVIENNMGSLCLECHDK